MVPMACIGLRGICSSNPFSQKHPFFCGKFQDLKSGTRRRDVEFHKLKWGGQSKQLFSLSFYLRMVGSYIDLLGPQFCRALKQEVSIGHAGNKVPDNLRGLMCIQVIG